MLCERECPPKTTRYCACAEPEVVFGGHSFSTLYINEAYRTKSVCENPYDTSKYLVL